MKMNSPPDSSRRRLSGRRVADLDRLSDALAVRGHDLRPIDDVDVRPGRELVDQVARHARLQRLAAPEDGHAARMVGEEDRRLSGRVAGADDVDVEAVGAGRLAARRAVGDALPDEPVEALDRKPPPGDATGEDDRPRAQDITAVEVDLMGRGFDPGDRPRDEDLRARAFALAGAHGLPARRRTRPSGSRGSSRSATTCRPGRRAPRARRRSRAGPRMHRRRPRRARPGPAPTITVSYSAAAGSVPRPSSSATRRSSGRTIVFPSTRRTTGQSRRRAADRPTARPLRRVGGDPVEGDLVAVEEASQLRAGGLPAIADDDRPRGGGSAAKPSVRVRRSGRSPACRPPPRPADERPRRRGSRGARLASPATSPPRGSPTGKTVPSVIGTSPKMSPGCRSPTTRSMPSRSWTASMRPSSTAKSARSPPSSAAYSPGASSGTSRPPRAARRAR